MEIHIEIGSACGLHCVHCSSESGRDKQKQQVPLEKLTSLISTIKKDVNLCICLTGGEPLTSPYLFQLLNSLKQFNNIQEIGLFSSGCIVSNDERLSAIDPGLANMLRENGISFCYLSLYSHMSDLHDVITGTSNSHRYAITSIKNMIDADIEVRIHTVPMQYNMNELHELIPYSANLGVTEVRLLRLVKHGRASNNWDLIGLDRNDQKTLLEDIINRSSFSKYGLRITAAGFPDICDCRPFGNGKKCQAGISLFYINLHGNIFPCASQKKRTPFCNIDEAISYMSGSFFNLTCLDSEKCLQDT